MRPDVVVATFATELDVYQLYYPSMARALHYLDHFQPGSEARATVGLMGWPCSLAQTAANVVYHTKTLRPPLPHARV